MDGGPLTRLKRKMTIENLWIYVLACLSDGPTYAYDIKKRISRCFGFTPSTITLYSVVYRLRKEGLIRESRNGCKTYELTGSGKKALEEAVKFMEENAKRIKNKVKQQPKKC